MHLIKPRGLVIAIGIILLALPVPPLSLALMVTTIYAWPPFHRRLDRLWRTGINRDSRLIREILCTVQEPFIAYHRSHRKRVIMLLITLSTLISISLLYHIERNGQSSNFLEYFLLKSFCIAWLFFSIFAYAVQLGLLSALTSGRTRQVVLSAAAVTCLALGKFLVIEHLGKIFPVQASALAQTLYVGAFIKALAIIAFGVIAFSVLIEFEMLALMAIDSRGKKISTTVSLVICHTAAILSSAFLFSILNEMGMGNTGSLALSFIAQDLDFTSNHMCDASPDEKVLFFEGVPDKALAAKFPALPSTGIISISSVALKNYMPTDFKMVSCNPVKEASQPEWCEDPRRFGYCTK